MRCLLLSLFSLPSLARVVMRRRSRRVRRYAQNVRPARPNVITGPVLLLATPAVSRTQVPPLPTRPLLAWGARRVDRFRLGIAVVPASFAGCQGVAA